MYSTLALSVAALIAVSIIVIGCFYLAAPERILGSFGLKLPAPDADTRAWLRLKGIRDIASGAVVLTMMLTATSRTTGIVLLVLAIIPLGDMSNILVSGGVEGKGVFRSWRDLRGHARRRSLTDLCGVETPPGCGS